MKLKSLKKFITEETNNSFNAFVEDVFEGKWNVAIKNFGTYTEKFHVKNVPVIYRIIFFKKEEIDQLTRASDLKRKIEGLLTAENQGHPRLFTKDDYHNIKDHLSYLASNGKKINGYTDESAEQYYMGIIISQKTGLDDNIDFDNYKGGNSEVTSRIEATKPVLAINAGSFKIVASLEFGDNGWDVNEFNGMDDLKGDNEMDQEITPDENEPEGEDQNVENNDEKNGRFQ